MNRRALVLLVAVTFGLTAFSACGGQAAAIHTQGRVLYMFLDLSDSIDEAQRTAWLAVWRKVVAGLSYGDSIRIFGIHDRTADAGPLFSDDIPILPEDPGEEVLRRTKRKLREVKSKALAELE